jgi:hypothetical protein
MPGPTNGAGSIPAGGSPDGCCALGQATVRVPHPSVRSWKGRYKAGAGRVVSAVLNTILGCAARKPRSMASAPSRRHPRRRITHRPTDPYRSLLESTIKLKPDKTLKNADGNGT